MLHHYIHYCATLLHYCKGGGLEADGEEREDACREVDGRFASALPQVPQRHDEVQVRAVDSAASASASADSTARVRALLAACLRGILWSAPSAVAPERLDEESEGADATRD